MTREMLTEQLLESNGHFRTLHEKHQECESILSEMKNRPYLNDDEQMQETELKRKKLRLKEQMEDILLANLNGKGTH